jgi:hypothetical protein
MSFLPRIVLMMTRLFVVLALVWERAVPVFFPALLFPALYLALAFFGTWENFGDPWRLIALLSSFGFGTYFAYQGIKCFAWPNKGDRARRLEADAGLSWRPLEILTDQPTKNDDPTAQVLWQAQKKRAAEALKGLRPQKPRAAWARADVYGLRAAAFLLVFAAFIVAGPRAGGRLDEAFAPRFLSQNTSAARIEAWITGPDYAQSPPKFLQGDNEAPLEVLAGSSFHIKISGSHRAPALYWRAGKKKRRLKLQKTGPLNYDLAVPVTQNGLIELKRPQSRLWQIRARADQPPRVIFTKAPHGDMSDALAFSYAARDDVGISALELVLSHDTPAGTQTDSTLLDLPAKNAKALDEKAMLDFTRHRWAGLPVTVGLVAHDGLGQKGETRPITLTLPGKLFVNPMAKAIAEQRTLIIRNDRPYAPMPERPILGIQDVRDRPPFAEDNPAERLQRAPKEVQRAAALMRASLRAPEMFFEDPLVYVGLRYAAENLRLARRADDYKALDNELWLLALWAEGGALAEARAAMKAAERAFRRALMRGAPADELARLMHNYERSVKRYLEALAEEALCTGKSQSGGSGGANLDGSELQEMLDALKALSETGARGDARKLLQALSALLEKMKMQLASGSGEGGDKDPVSEAMRKALEELGDITAEQREILDEAFRQQNQSKGAGAPQNGQQKKGGQSGSGLAGEQESLGARLRALADGERAEGREGADELADGAKDMGAASEALKEGNIDGALEAGKDALLALRDGSEVLASELFDYMQKKNGKGEGENRDPFGRPTRGGGSQSSDGTSVPDVINAERAREILQMLRDRAAEQGRSNDELDYLDRLLERF